MELGGEGEVVEAVVQFGPFHGRFLSDTNVLKCYHHIQLRDRIESKLCIIMKSFSLQHTYILVLVPLLNHPNNLLI